MSRMPLALARQVVDLFRIRMKPSKVERMERILARRQRGRALVLENLNDPLNAAACLRSADAFGFQDVHIIDRYNRFDEHRTYHGQARRHGGTGSVMAHRAPDTGGSGRWLTVTYHATAADCLSQLQREGPYQLLVSDVHDHAVDLATAAATLSAAAAAPAAGAELGNSRCCVIGGPGGGSAQATAAQETAGRADTPAAAAAVDGTSATASSAVPYDESGRNCAGDNTSSENWAVVFGNENRGVSKYMRRHAAQSFWLPTVGFVESLNISVACGASLFYLSTAFPAPEGLSEEQHADVMAHWLLRSYGPGARQLMEKHGVDLDDF